MKYEVLVQKGYWHPTPAMKKLMTGPVDIWPHAKEYIITLEADELIEPLLNKMPGLVEWRFLYEA